MDQVALVTEETFNWIREVSSNLFHPLTVCLVDYSCDVNATSLEIDGEQDEISYKSAPSQNFHREEVHCSYRTPMSFEECLPSRSFTAFGCWFNACIGQNALDGISAEIVAKIPECSAQFLYSPNPGLRQPFERWFHRFRCAKCQEGREVSCQSHRHQKQPVHRG